MNKSLAGTALIPFLAACATSVTQAPPVPAVSTEPRFEFKTVAPGTTFSIPNAKTHRMATGTLGSTAKFTDHSTEDTVFFDCRELDDHYTLELLQPMTDFSGSIRHKRQMAQFEIAMLFAHCPSLKA